jgi:hypothetical protein
MTDLAGEMLARGAGSKQKVVEDTDDNHPKITGRRRKMKKTKYVAPKIVGSAVIHPC